MALHVMDEANRCLGCKFPQCQKGCPISTPIPEVIKLLKANKLDELRENIEKLDKSKEIIVHCHSGLRSYLACRILKQKGYNVKNLIVIKCGFTLYP